MPLDIIQDAILNRKMGEMEGLIDRALEQDLDPKKIMNVGLITPMDIIGKQFSEGTIFVPEMMLSAMIMKTGLERLRPHLLSRDLETRGKILIGTVKGDLHDIGKNIVALMLEASGFDVVDLGIDLESDVFIQKIEEHEPQILGLSALLTTTMNEITNVVEAMIKAGVRDKVKVIVGGAPLNQEFARQVGTDGYGADATEAVRICKELIGDF
jgi:5-methyltetrahydrofolate--homocysteine methyltransferase